MVVVDPPYEFERVPEWNKIARILRYYSSAAHLAGFWRLGDLLYERSLALQAAQSAVDFDHVPFDYANILKLGRTVEIRQSGNQLLAFFSRETSTPTLFEADGYAFVFGLNETLIHLLENQDFDAILNYESPTGVSDFGPRSSVLVNTNDNGTVMAAIPVALLK